MTIATGFVKSIDEDGIIEGYASTFHNTDVVGDVIQPGAFKDSLDHFIRNGYFYDHHDKNKRLGTVVDAWEDVYGLFVRLRFHTSAFAQEVRKAIKERLLRGKTAAFSIGYRALDSVPLDQGRTLLRKIRLDEVSLVGMPANPLALVSAVKSEDQILRDANTFHEIARLMIQEMRYKASLSKGADVVKEWELTKERRRRANAILDRDPAFERRYPGFRKHFVTVERDPVVAALKRQVEVLRFQVNNPRAVGWPPGMEIKNTSALVRVR